MKTFLTSLRSLEDSVLAEVAPDRRWRGRIAVRGAVGMAPWGLVYAVLFTVIGSPWIGLSLVLAAVMIAASPAVLWKTGSPVKVGHLITAGLFQSLLAPTWMMGGLFAPGVPWLAFCTLFATVVAGKRAGILWTSLNVCFVGVLYGAWTLGVLPEPPPPDQPIWLLAASTYVGFFMIIGVVAVAAVSSVERQRVALEEARLVALDASETKSTFLASMSHELRTPMNAILGYAEMLREDAGPEEQADLERIHTAGTHLLGLINDILDLSKVEAGEMPFRIGKVDAVSVVHDVLDQAAPLLQAGRNTVEVRKDGPVWILADRTRLLQCVLNLVSNASKFTSDGVVRVCVKQKDDRVCVAVRDTGRGMTEEQLLAVFEPFVQVSDQAGGTGLGLAIVKQFVERMGGSVEAASSPGVGSTFTLWLPAG